MKKSLLLIAILIFTGVIVTSCDTDLDEIPKSFASPSNFFKNEEDANAAVTAVYNSLQDGAFAGFDVQYHTTDVVRTAYWNTQGGMGTYTMTGDNTQFVLKLWSQGYKAINIANAAINNVPNVEMDEIKKNVLISEATFVRALVYFRLVRLYGNIPLIINETTSLSNEALQVPPSTPDEIYAQIIEDLEYCISNLKSKSETGLSRASIGAAKTLLSKVYLTMGSMEKRDNNGDGKTFFTKAASLAQEVITSGEFVLTPYYPDAFVYTNKNNEEIIFDVPFITGQVDDSFGFVGQNMGLQGNPNFGGSWGSAHATDYYHTIFEDTDVVREQWSAPHDRVLGPGNLRTTYPEMAGQPWKIGKFRRFPVREEGFNPQDWQIHWPVFRYAEVLLIKAEATNEINNGPTADTFAALNELRTRARNKNVGEVWEDILPRELTVDPSILPDITSAQYPDYAAMHQYIMDERARELGGEFKRWFDLVRWGKLIERIKLLQTFIPEGRTRPESNWDPVANNIQEKHLLMPIPNSEIRSNPNLKQNPGYN